MFLYLYHHCIDRFSGNDRFNRFIGLPIAVDLKERFRDEIKQKFGSEDDISIDSKLDKLIANELFPSISGEWSIILRVKPADIECFGVAFGFIPLPGSRDNDIIQLIENFLMANPYSDLSELPQVLKNSIEFPELWHPRKF
jgi:hypothetical protein